MQLVSCVTGECCLVAMHAECRVVGFNDETSRGTHSTKWYDKKWCHAILHNGEMHCHLPVNTFLPEHILLPELISLS